jgi:hypothetical protein
MVALVRYLLDHAGMIPIYAFLIGLTIVPMFIGLATDNLRRLLMIAISLLMVSTYIREELHDRPVGLTAMMIAIIFHIMGIILSRMTGLMLILGMLVVFTLFSCGR